MKYSEKLKDPRWQKKRLKIFERDNFECQQCGDGESTVCVHHLRYVSGWEPWDYPDHLLLTLCESCHAAEYEGMSEAIGFLIEQVKEKFLSGSVQNLATAINGLTFPFPPDVVSTAISWAFQDKEMVREICDRYFKSLSADRKYKREEEHK